MYSIVKFFIFFIFVCSLQANENTLFHIEDKSGYSKNLLKDKVQKIDLEQSNKIFDDVKKQTQAFDWIELESGEWLKGNFKALYEKEVEFDSKEFKLQTFDFDDVRQIRTHRIVTVAIQIDENKNIKYFDLQGQNIEISGVLRIKEEVVTIIQGIDTYTFNRDQIVSIAYGGETELQLWSGKLTFNLDIQQGNTQQLNYSSLAYLMRRTSQTRLRFDYLGNIAHTQTEEISNNTRLDESFDIFMTKEFFITPITIEYVNDFYQNIDQQWMFGAGVGHSIFDEKGLEWEISIIPALIFTQNYTVSDDANRAQRSFALRFKTRLDMEITKHIDLKCDYQFTKLDEASGSYNHHTITQLENEITSWLDFDITVVWDYVENPIAYDVGEAPEKSDLQLLVGLGVEF